MHRHQVRELLDIFFPEKPKQVVGMNICVNLLSYSKVFCDGNQMYSVVGFEVVFEFADAFFDGAFATWRNS